SDLFRSTDQYRLNIQANPTVPIVTVFAQAPNAKAAETPANSAVDGLRDYLAAAAKRPQQARPKDEPLITQLGRAHGTVINGGVRVQAFALTFAIVFALACAVTVLVGRVRRGWLEAHSAERTVAG